MNKKAWLDHIYYDIGNQQYDFYVCGLKKTEDGVIATKWKKYSEVIFPIDFNEDYKIEWVNQRQILPIELVLDLEDKAQLKPVVESLKKNFNWDFHIYSTGSRGYHIHIFFNKEIDEKYKEDVISFFKADLMKIYMKSMIALENTSHWKSGKIKQEVQYGDQKE